MRKNITHKKSTNPEQMLEPIKKEKTHAKYSPSILRNKEICPAFENDDSGEKLAATEGELGHEYMEEWLELHTAQTLEERTASEKRIRELETTPQISDLQPHLVKMISYVEPFVQTARAIHTELSLDLSFLQVEGCDKGTADAIIQDALDELHLFDWKFGRIEVDDAETNIQLQAYALAALRKFDAKVCTIHILQPKRDEVSTHLITINDEAKLMLRIRKIVLEASVPNPETRPNDSTCVWCKNLSFCPAVRKYALVPAYGTLPDLEKMVTVTKELLMNQPELAGQMQTLANILEKWASETKALCVQLAAEGNEVPGFKLIQTKGRRSCVDNVGLYRFLQDTYGVTPELFLTWCQVSVSKIESELGKTAPRGSQGKAAEQIAHEIAEQGFIQNGNPVMYLSKVKAKK